MKNYASNRVNYPKLLTSYLSEKVYEELRLAAFQERQSIAEYSRNVIVEALAKRREDSC